MVTFNVSIQAVEQEVYFLILKINKPF